jgi:PIN domain nuclease of toxin-antitoxin system
MNLLLDTHTFLWSVLQPKRLPPVALKAVQDQGNDIFVSSVSLWEISIKVRLGKMDLISLTTHDLIPSAVQMGFSLMALSPDEAVTQGDLRENTHFDPFDRMLIWQAISRKLTLVSGDKEFSKFRKDGLKILWK